MKFKDLFDLNKDEMLPSRERVHKRINKRLARPARIIAFISSACAVLAVGLVLAFNFLGRTSTVLPQVVTGAINVVRSVEAATQTGLGIKTTSALKITTTEDIPVDELKARLSVEPAAAFKLSRTGDCAYELRFNDALEENVLYNLQAVYNGKVVYRWAFQTETVFKVTSAMPENETHVALDSAVEVAFSHADVTGFKEAFSIYPAVEGTFEHYGRTWAFVPSKPLNSGTLYTVTVKKDVIGPEGTALAGDYQFSFTTTNEGSYAYLIYQQNEAADTFLVNESPIAVVCYNQTDVSKASVKVYSFADHNAYTEAYKTYVRNGGVSSQIATLAGEAFRQFDVTPVLISDYNGIYDHAAFINYPEPLTPGYYFAEIEIGGYKLYQLLQSTTLSVYTITTNGDYTVWVNDTQSGEPIADATVKLEGFKDTNTNGVGVANFKGAKEALEQRVLTVEYGSHPYVVVLDGGAVDPEVAGRNDYYFYVSTGSTLYRATDTVQIFGVILPRKSKVDLPDEVTLRCDSIGAEIKAEVAGNGSFTASMPLNNTAATYGNIDLMLGDVWLTSTYFNVADYELPVYQVTVTTDRTAYKVGDSIQYTAQVTYMDGTPASGIPVSSGYEGLSGVTDENGCFSGSYIAGLYNSEYYSDTSGPEIHSLDFSVDNGTDEYYGSTAAFLVFESSCYLKADYADGVLTVHASNVDFDLADQIDRDLIYSDGYDEKNFKGGTVSLNLTGELHEITYEKKPMGTSYDAVNKKVVYTWQYEEVDTLVRTVELTVTDGVGTLELPEQPDENRNYYVLLHSDAGTVQRYLTNYNYAADSRNTYCFNTDKMTADINETVELLVRDGRNNEAINSGSVLYTAVSGELVENFHSSSARYSMKFKKDYAPDVMIYGAYFDGKHVYDLGSQFLNYDLENSRLQIEMEKDQAQYSPGDEVTLSFKVTDDEGNPVKTALNLSVLDRALYMIGGDFEEPLYALYGTRCFSTTVYTTVSHRDFTHGSQQYGEGGGDGELGRGDFEDTPYFETVKTNASGEATVTFTLPDTITEWKVVARAVSEDVQAGMEVFELRSTQDYFAHVSMSDTVKVTDDFTVAVKGEGMKAPADVANSFTVGITDRDGNEIKTLTGSAEKSKYLYLNFGRLEAGLYTAYIQAECGELKDSIIKTFTVEETQSSVWIHHHEKVESGVTLQLTPARGNAVLTVVDVEKAFWQKAMARLKSNAGSRVDQVLGQYLAEEFYSTGAWMDRDSLDYSVIRSYMDYDGVKLQQDYDYSDLRVSAKLAAVAPEFCDQEELRYSFERYLNDRYAARVDVLIAYFGLAALGEPVLNDLQTIYVTQSDLSAEEAAYLALGFAYSGDYNTAQYVFDTHLKELLVTEEGVTYAALDGSVEEDLTGCCTLLSNRLGLEYSEGLISFIINTDTEYTLLNLELISYLNDHVSDLTGANKVTITTGDGRNETYTYQRIGELVLTLSPAQASNVRVVNIEGRSAVSYAYSGTVEDLQKIGEAHGSVGAEIPNELSVGEVQEITLEILVPENYELPMLDLVLPAGLRFESGSVFAGEWEYAIVPEFDRKRINIPLTFGNNTVSVWVRGAMPGSYEMEPVVVTNAADNQYISTDSLQISIAGT